MNLQKMSFIGVVTSKEENMAFIMLKEIMLRMVMQLFMKINKVILYFLRRMIKISD